MSVRVAGSVAQNLSRHTSRCATTSIISLGWSLKWFYRRSSVNSFSADLHRRVLNEDSEQVIL